MRILKIHIVAIIFVSLIFLAAATYLLATPITASAPRYTQISRGQIATSETCPYSFVSWNLHEMSLRKTDSALTLMTETLREADIVAVQEVVAGSGFGARQISNLEARLDRTGAEWDSVTSNPTSSSSGSSERYAYLVKRPIIIRRDSATLVQELDATVEREPFLLEVRFPNRKVVRLLNVHAVPTRRRPLPEVEALTSNQYFTEVGTVIVGGDFNLPGRVIDPLFSRNGFRGYIDEKTSLGRKLDARGEYRRNQYDNIYTKGDIVVCSSGVIDFVPRFGNPVTTESLRAARSEISDHLPVFITFGFTK